MWVPRIEEFNRCTGAQVRLEYLPEGEDGMADALRADLGDDSDVEQMGGNGGQQASTPMRRHGDGLRHRHAGGAAPCHGVYGKWFAV